MGVPATRDRLLDTTERLMIEAASLDDVSVRRIADAADVNLSAISYHFGSRDRLIVAVTQRVYDRLNAERHALLNQAIAAAAPDPPRLRAVIEALIGPSLRWSRDPSSSYGVFVKAAGLPARSRNATIRQSLETRIDHLRPFFPAFKAAAPHLDDADIGWRIHCALGVRHYATRRLDRALLLANGTIDAGDTEALLQRTIDVIEPMFRA